MALPLNSVIEVTYQSRFANQQYMNVLHYAVAAASASPTVTVELNRILDALDTPGEFGILGELLAVLPPNCMLTNITVQGVTPGRTIRQSRVINEAGVWPTAALTGNLGATITKQTDLGGRRFVGSIHVPCLPPDAHALGELNELYIAPLLTLKDAMLVPIVDPVDGGQYDPVILHRPSALSPTPAPTPITAGVVQPQARVMRRRTVGVGI